MSSLQPTAYSLKSKVRILLVVSRLQRGGLEQVLLDVARGLAGRGIEFAVAAVTGRGERDEEFRAAGIPVHALPGTASLWPAGWAGNVRTFVALARLIRAWRPHVVQTHHFSAGLMGRLAALAAGGPACLQAEHNFYLWKGAVARAVDRWLARGTARFVVPSSAVADHVARTHGVPADRVTIVPNGFAPPTLASRAAAFRALGLDDDGTPHVLFAGRLVPAKGPRIFLQVARRLTRSAAAARFVIAGEGPMRASLEAESQAAGVGDRVRFVGSVPGLARLMAAFDLFVSCSLEEGFGLSAAEAIAAGVPAVLPALPAFRELAPWRAAGEFPPVGDAGAIARACEAVLGDPRRSLAAAAAERERILGRIDLGAMLSGYEALYRGLVAAAALGAAGVTGAGLA